MPLWVGTSGWQYAHWKERFYPAGVPQRLWLEYFAERFRTVEVNNAFYMLPKPETFAAWARRSPDDFIVAVKMNRYVTHIRRLRDVGESVKRFMDHARHLGSKLGPVLLQLPPNLRIDRDGLAQTISAIGPGVRIAVEFRHDTWYTDEIQRLLTDNDVALCLADRESKMITPEWRTASWGYVRFHEGAAWPQPCYGRSSMTTWAGRVARLWGGPADVYAYFNNDPQGCAIRDARVFAAAAERLGLSPSRVPAAGDIRVG